MNTLLDRACDAPLKVKSTSITSDHSRPPVWGAEFTRGKNVAFEEIGLLKLRFRGTLSRTFQRKI
jgi:hypothetical protein